MTLTRFRSEKVPPTAGSINNLASPLLSKDLSAQVTGQNAQDHTGKFDPKCILQFSIDYIAIEKQFSDVLQKDYKLE